MHEEATTPKKKKKAGQYVWQPEINKIEEETCVLSTFISMAIYDISYKSGRGSKKKDREVQVFIFLNKKILLFLDDANKIIRKHCKNKIFPVI